MERTFFRATPPPTPTPTHVRYAARSSFNIAACPSSLAPRLLLKELLDVIKPDSEGRATDAPGPQVTPWVSRPEGAFAGFCHTNVHSVCVKCLCQCSLTRTKGAKVPSGQRVCFRQLCRSCEEPLQPLHDVKCESASEGLRLVSKLPATPLKVPQKMPPPSTNTPINITVGCFYSEITKPDVYELIRNSKMPEKNIQ